jgi:hypothetical protein
MQGVKYKSLPPVTNEYHGLLVTWEANSRLAPADKSNHYKLQANYSTTLIMETC